MPAAARLIASIEGGREERLPDGRQFRRPFRKISTSRSTRTGTGSSPTAYGSPKTGVRTRTRPRFQAPRTLHELEEGRDDLDEHVLQVRARVLRVVELRAEEGLAHAAALRERRRRHEDVDPVARDRPVPALVREEPPREVAGEAEVPADRLPNAPAVERAGQRVDDRVRDRAVVAVPRVERRHEVVPVGEHGREEELDPLGRDAPQVAVDDAAGAGTSSSAAIRKIVRSALPFPGRPA